MNVEQQMKIANDVLVKIKMNIDEDAIIAGGAPRNWDEGKLANDIDLYTRCFVNNTTGRLKKLLNRIFETELKFTQDTDIKNYKFGIDIEIARLITFDYNGVKIQLIICNPNREYKSFKTDVVSHMDIGLNRICCDWYASFDKGLVKTKEYISDRENCYLTLYQDCMTPEQLKHCLGQHLPKMQRYYPEYKLTIADGWHEQIQ